MRRKFYDDEYYHIYNRGVEKIKIFADDYDYQRFLLCLNLLNDKKDGLLLKWRDYVKNNQYQEKVRLLARQKSDFEPLVEIIAYCFNQNHYHLILKQLVENGLAKFMQKLGTSYTKYFNAKYNRNGVLFQGKFKSKAIVSNSYLLWLSVYVNLNHELHLTAKGNKVEKLWPWSSYSEYIGEFQDGICNSDVIIGQLGGVKDYREYCRMNFGKLIENKKLKEYYLE